MDVLVLLRDGGMTEKDLNSLEFEACESGAKFLTQTSEDLSYEVLVELVEETISDEKFSAAIIANAAATMEISGLDRAEILAEIETDFNSFQSCMMDFVKINLASEFSTEFELSVASGFATFDYES